MSSTQPSGAGLASPLSSKSKPTVPRRKRKRRSSTSQHGLEHLQTHPKDGIQSSPAEKHNVGRRKRQKLRAKEELLPSKERQHSHSDKAKTRLKAISASTDASGRVAQCQKAPFKVGKGKDDRRTRKSRKEETSSRGKRQHNEDRAERGRRHESSGTRSRPRPFLRARSVASSRSRSRGRSRSRRRSSPSEGSSVASSELLNIDENPFESEVSSDSLEIRSTKRSRLQRAEQLVTFVYKPSGLHFERLLDSKYALMLSSTSMVHLADPSISLILDFPKRLYHLRNSLRKRPV